MKLVDHYPIVVTAPERLAVIRDFYTQRLGFTVGFEATWFLLLSLDGERPVTLGFMASDHPSSPPGPEVFDGRGVFLTLQVEDAAVEHDRLRAAGAEIALPLRAEPWGQRRFALVDPAGVWLDVVEQIEPDAGWWDLYLT